MSQLPVAFTCPLKNPLVFIFMKNPDVGIAVCVFVSGLFLRFLFCFSSARVVLQKKNVIMAPVFLNGQAKCYCSLLGILCFELKASCLQIQPILLLLFEPNWKSSDELPLLIVSVSMSVPTGGASVVKHQLGIQKVPLSQVKNV